jgi:hypothetical protein
MSITTRIETVTPELAAKYLEKNISNRPIRKQHVRDFAKMMKDGDFKCSHQGIAFDSKGQLLDGQHRLAGIIEAGIPVEMMITEGCDAGTFKYIDCGTNRHLNDRVRFDESNEKNSKITAVCAALISITSLGSGTKKLNSTYSAEAVERIYSIYKDSIAAILYGVYFTVPKEQLQTFARNRNVLATLVLYHSRVPAEALDFATRLLNGVGSVGDPVRQTYAYLSSRANRCSSNEMLRRIYWGINKNHTGDVAKHAGQARSPYFLKAQVKDAELDDILADPISA